ncbi:hypothetical protein CPAR01_05215 [Colletotrichum paranaense]|uniref:Uncharacterized protein n=2 Tax=Colletotrichum acutatum species complex TaxID=2707335 RepID=A0ABQ9PCU6_9PEZI|nr:uncharacterized protein CPAR01_05215 [Colletotrichum paranaense]KAK0368988.1 hypothetical protein CLIM01_13656 [Colletotrichum limetticola]KAK1541828.1 hypothetical protein CPAR01_05215 [Colletotrichum paranaense]
MVNCATTQQGQRRRHGYGECRNMLAGRIQTYRDAHLSISQNWPPPGARHAAHLECKPSREPVLQALQRGATLGDSTFRRRWTLENDVAAPRCSSCFKLGMVEGGCAKCGVE